MHMPRDSQASAQIVATPPELLITATRLPREGVGGEQLGDVEQLFQGIGPDDAGLMEQGLHLGIVPGLAPMWSGPCVAQPGSARSSRTGRLLPGDPAGQPGEAAGFPKVSR